jgi:hypothetical protein
MTTQEEFQHAEARLRFLLALLQILNLLQILKRRKSGKNS